MASATSKIALSTSRDIPFNKLLLSACNVRRVKAGVSIQELADDIARRTPLHPHDQFRAFLGLREKGQSEEEIAAAFFVSVAVVKQRLRLASVSPRLLEVYAEDGMTLDQLMAFTVSGDWERQEQVWERLASSYSKEPYVICRQLTEGAVRASDKRARFIGEAYEAEGGTVLRDLFQGDDGGWLQDVALVEQLVAERLEREANAIRADTAAESFADPEQAVPDDRHDAEPPVEHWQVAAE